MPLQMSWVSTCASVTPRPICLCPLCLLELCFRVLYLLSPSAADNIQTHKKSLETRMGKCKRFETLLNHQEPHLILVIYTAVAFPKIHLQTPPLSHVSPDWLKSRGLNPRIWSCSINVHILTMNIVAGKSRLKSVGTEVNFILQIK